VYRVDQLPDAVGLRACGARSVAKRGYPLSTSVQSFGITDPRPYGFDSAVEFPPHTKRALVDPKFMPGVNHDRGYLEDYLAIVRQWLRKAY